MIPSAESRRLRSVFSDWELDELADNLHDIDEDIDDIDHDIDYFYNLMINGKTDDIMDAF